ncbi:mechanosensitive ion channel family protein [Leptospira sp. GIMC2001]|uniref:mechanosensitive ion channel family protein n=1 Tax=Leptospira sp. GIMC2001 TaxID=1513297 RepID=UPI002349FA1A|nr:mechanosensitive ion channel family protein [Leptospira sp. GIMC2001]WCL49029.1 mechanosensitive ion channel family protein [Leptospira sp. GIMC2001]
MWRYVLFILLATPIFSENILDHVKTDSPRESIQSFMEAMDDYRIGVLTKDSQKQLRIDDAVRTLNLSDVPLILRKEKGQETAILLKEVFDRLFVLDYEKYPDTSEIDGKRIQRWRIENTEITLVRINEGEREGEYLFSKETIDMTMEFYDKVKHLPYINPKTGGALYQEPWIENYIWPWMRKKYLNIFIWQWIGLSISILLGLTLRTIAKFLLEKLFVILKNRKTYWDHRIVEEIKSPFTLLLATLVWYLSLRILRFHGDVLGFFHSMLKLTLSIGVVWIIYGLMEVISDYLKSLAAKTASTLDDQLVPLISKSLKVLVVIFGTLVAIQNLGVNVMGVLAGLGIGGLAFALAAKDGVANFFGSLMILFDKPFQVGDWIVVNGSEGVVEEVGFRSTRIRTFYNSVVSIPNAEMMNAKIDNMGRRQYRRLFTKLGLTYDTPPAKIQEFVDGIKTIIGNNPTTWKENVHVYFNDFGADSLVIMVYFFFEVSIWKEELQNREDILMKIKILASEIGVEFAFPTQTLHIESIPDSWKKID